MTVMATTEATCESTLSPLTPTTPPSISSTSFNTSSATMAPMTNNPIVTTLPPISISGYATDPDLPPGSTLRWVTSVSYKTNSTDASTISATITTSTASPRTIVSPDIPSTSTTSIEAQSTWTALLSTPTPTSAPSVVPSILTSCSTNSLAQSAIPNTTAHPTTSPTLPHTSTTPASMGNHAQDRSRVMMIAIPVSVGVAALLIGLFFLWRRYHATLVQKLVSLCPYHTELAHWADTRDRNRRMRELRTPEGMKESNHSPTGGEDPYERRLRQYEQESIRAREKYSFETPPTPLSGKRSEGGILAGSPWKKHKIASPKISYDASRGPEMGRRMYGPFKKNFNDETGSLESWEEEWLNLGTNGAESASSTADLRKGGEVKDNEDKIERVAGPGMSWRKLV